MSNLNLKELFETLNKGNETLKIILGETHQPLYTSIKTKINSTAKDADAGFKTLEQLLSKGMMLTNPVSVHSFVRGDQYVVEYVYPEYVVKEDISLELKKEDTYSLITFAIKHKDNSERENAEHITSYVKSTLSFNHQFMVKNHFAVDEKEYVVEHKNATMEFNPGKIELLFPLQLLNKEESVVKFM